MPRFPKLAAASAASGFAYYKITTFSFAVGGQFLPKVAGGIYSQYSGSSTIARSRPVTRQGSDIITDVLFNVDVSDAAGSYRLGNHGVDGTIITGSSGGFPIVYQYNLGTSSDANNLTFTLEVGNPSAVNDVTPSTINISGKVFFYLAPF